MRIKAAMRGLALASALAMFIGGCGGSDAYHRDVAGSATTDSVEPFVSLMTRGVDVDYDPLATPADAVQAGDLIVEGTVAGVTEGVSLEFADPLYTQRWSESYATLVIAVEQVISGDTDQVHNGKVFVQVLKNRAASPGDLAATSKDAQVVAVLDNLEGWSPAAGVDVVRPGTVPPAATLLAAYTDGLWLQGPADEVMYGIGVEPAELGPAWGGADTVAEYAAKVRQAA
jgi:hypothetical protein